MREREMPIRTIVDLMRLHVDLSWAAIESSSLLWAGKRLLEVSPKSETKKPVMSVPGFTGPEVTLAPMTKYLRRVGFDAETWGMGTNEGPGGGNESLEKQVFTMGEKLKAWADRSGEKVSLIGHSLGGIYVREAARMFPDYVDRVITLGTSADMTTVKSIRCVNSCVRIALSRATGRTMTEALDHDIDILKELLVPPPGIPVVSIYSSFDGVVTGNIAAIPPQYLGSPGAMPRENIKIAASHCGMTLNPIVLLAIADRLIEDTDRWEPFDAKRYFNGVGSGAFLKAFYPGSNEANIPT